MPGMPFSVACCGGPANMHMPTEEEQAEIIRAWEEKTKKQNGEKPEEESEDSEEQVEDDEVEDDEVDDEVEDDKVEDNGGSVRPRVKEPCCCQTRHNQ